MAFLFRITQFLKEPIHIKINIYLFQFLLETWKTQSCIQLIIARKRSLRRLCFHRCLSVHGGGLWQTSPIHWADTPSSGRHPPGQTPPSSRHPSWADTPMGRHHPPGIRLTSGWYASHWNAFLLLITL